MGFLTLLEVASMPILQVIIISLLGAFLASEFCNVLVPDARHHLNKIVFVVFTPCIMFANLAKSVTLDDIISWWFMPVNVGLTFLFGGILGWLAVKILKPKRHLEGIIIATCSTGNLGNLLMIIVPAICDEDSSPFGEPSICSTNGLSYAAFSMALGGIFIWTYTYQLMKTSSLLSREIQLSEDTYTTPKKDFNSDLETHLLKIDATIDEDKASLVFPVRVEDTGEVVDDETMKHASSSNGEQRIWGRLKVVFCRVMGEVLSPPTVGAILGFIFGATHQLKSLLVGDGAPLRVVQDSIKLLGDGTIPSLILILGGNLAQGIRTSKLKPLMIIVVMCVRYIILPSIGVFVVKAADQLGFLPKDPLYHYVLMIQFTLPPAMSIATMAQLFNVGQEECSILFLWAHLVAAFALTIWSTIYMWLLS